MRPRQAAGRRPRVAEAGQGRRHRPDYWLLMLSVALLVIGLIVLYAISPGLVAQSNVGQNYFINRQLLAIFLGVGAFVAMANIPISFWKRHQTQLIWLAVAAALAVRLFGQRVNGAYRWIQLGGMSFQAAELIKFALLIWLAGFFVQRIREGSMGDFNRTIKPLIIALAIIGLVVGKIQSDFGSTAVMVAMMAAIAFIAGMPFKRVLMVGGVIIIGAIILIAPSSYRRSRLLTFMHPQSDCQTTGYQVCQALITVGSGGIFGLGVANSVQAYGYLPEAANDSIFAILAEKFGFIGVTVLIGIFVGIFRRMFKIAEEASDDYSRLIVVGVLAWLSTQVLINVGAMLGLLPLKGITLPFISYGGTSVLFVMGAIGLVFQISRQTGYRSFASNHAEGRGAYEGSVDRRGNGRSHYTAVSRRPGA